MGERYVNGYKQVIFAGQGFGNCLLDSVIISAACQGIRLTGEWSSPNKMRNCLVDQLLENFGETGTDGMVNIDAWRQNCFVSASMIADPKCAKILTDWKKTKTSAVINSNSQQQLQGVHSRERGGVTMTESDKQWHAINKVKTDSLVLMQATVDDYWLHRSSKDIKSIPVTHTKDLLDIIEQESLTKLAEVAAMAHEQFCVSGILNQQVVGNVHTHEEVLREKVSNTEKSIKNNREQVILPQLKRQRPEFVAGNTPICDCFPEVITSADCAAAEHSQYVQDVIYALSVYCAGMKARRSGEPEWMDVSTLRILVKLTPIDVKVHDLNENVVSVHSSNLVHHFKCNGLPLCTIHIVCRQQNHFMGTSTWADLERAFGKPGYDLNYLRIDGV